MKIWFLYGAPERGGNYVTAFRRGGGRVCAAETRERARLCDALLLMGGGDIHPRRYGQSLAFARDIDEARDAAEFSLVGEFLERGRPIVGICRGLQLINVYFGGTLHQHMEGHGQVCGRDTIHLTYTNDPLLRALYGETLFVNSAHHQAVDRLGMGLRAVQWASDGTVEALRHESLPIFAVQWHPERLHAAAGSSGAEGAAVIAALCRWAEKV